MAALDSADVYFRIGVSFEETLMERITGSMPQLNVIDLRRGIDLQPVSGDTGAHAHGRMDPHTWLSPELAAVQARTIHEELVRLDADGAATYSANLEELVSDLEEVDREVRETLRPFAGREMFVFHPAFGYFARAYDLVQVPIEIEGKEPAPRELESLIELARERRFGTIFVQPEFSDASARAIAVEVGAEIVRLDPLARDYITNLREMANNMRDGLATPGESQ